MQSIQRMTDKQKEIIKTIEFLTLDNYDDNVHDKIRRRLENERVGVLYQIKKGVFKNAKYAK